MLVDAYDTDHLHEIKPQLPALLNQLFSLMSEVHPVQQSLFAHLVQNVQWAVFARFEQTWSPFYAPDSVMQTANFSIAYVMPRRSRMYIEWCLCLQNLVRASINDCAAASHVFSETSLTWLTTGGTFISYQRHIYKLPNTWPTWQLVLFVLEMKIEIHSLLRENLAYTVNTRFTMQVDNEDLVFTLESIVEKFGEDMAPYALGLCQHLTQAFWRLEVFHSILKSLNLKK